MTKVEHTILALPFSTLPLLLGMAVVLWVAVLNIMYACQDVEFDRCERLHSIPRRFGIAKALRISPVMHLGMILTLAVVFWNEGLGVLSLGGLLVVGVLLAYEHSPVKATNLSRIRTAFLTVNGWISVLLFVTSDIDIIWH